MSNLPCTILSPYTDQRGGAELSLIHALRTGRENGIGFSLAAPCEGEIVTLARELGLPVSLFGQSRTRNALGYARSVQTIRSFCKDQGSRLLLSWDAQPHFRGAAAGLLSGVPTAWFRKGGVDGSRTSRLLARLPARAILANSVYTAERQAAVQQQIGNPKPIHVVPSAVDLDEFDPARLPPPQACRERLGLPRTGPLVVLVGRLQSWKGFHTLIEALPRVRKECPDAKVVLVGGEHPSEPDYRASLERLAKEQGVSDAVHLSGFASHDEIAAYMQAADVFVHASVGEPFGIVVIEAMALGKPVVAAAEGGPTTVICDGFDGLLADPQDPTSLAAQITRVLTDRRLASSLGEAARRRAGHFSIEHFGRRLAAAIRTIVEAESEPGIIVEEMLRPTSEPLSP